MVLGASLWMNDPKQEKKETGVKSLHIDEEVAVITNDEVESTLDVELRDLSSRSNSAHYPDKKPLASQKSLQTSTSSPAKWMANGACS